MDIFNQKFTTGDVATAVGCTPAQIADWCSKGLIVGHRGDLGRGRKREFSWFNVMEVATAVALMEIGIRAPSDAFRAAVHFSHLGEGATGWVGDDGISEDDEQIRHPGLPFHYREGETFLVISGDQSQVILSDDGTISLNAAFPGKASYPGLIAVNLSAVFFGVMHRMGLDGREVLDEAYGQ